MSVPSLIRLATRGSRLALAQSSHVADALIAVHPGLHVDILVIKTRGDQIQGSLQKRPQETKGVFTREVELALLEDKADLAVHSAKDLGVEVAPQTLLVGAPRRESPLDCCLIKPGTSMEGGGTTLFTGSIRRRLQWLDRYPKFVIQPIRGNIDTRIDKLIAHPGPGVLLLAEAGLNRLQPDLRGCETMRLDRTQMVPAPGQGCLALQCREEDTPVISTVRAICDPMASLCLAAERYLIKAMEAGCQEPLGAYARVVEEDQLHFSGIYYPTSQAGHAVRAEVTGKIEEPARVAEDLADRLRRSP